jgi:hypothetical protein
MPTATHHCAFRISFSPIQAAAVSRLPNLHRGSTIALSLDVCRPIRVDTGRHSPAFPVLFICVTISIRPFRASHFHDFSRYREICLAARSAMKKALPLKGTRL